MVLCPSALVYKLLPLSLTVPRLLDIWRFFALVFTVVCVCALMYQEECARGGFPSTMSCLSLLKCLADPLPSIICLFFSSFFRLMFMDWQKSVT